jgi:hypothetical protein
MFGLAEVAERRGDAALADAIYRALSEDPVLAIRSEARFRRAMWAVRTRQYARSALLLRQILDEQPGAQRVRLELARVLELLDDEDGARRQLRAARASGLPPGVAKFVDRYSAVLRARKPLGGSIDLAIAPDSNVNRATRDDTLGTILGDFTLDKDAKQKSGIGLAVRGQAYGRLKVSSQTTLLARVSAAADIYRKSDFSTGTLTLAAGPELALERDRLAIEAAATWRTFGGKRLASGVSLLGTYLHPLGSVSQMRVTASVARLSNYQNRLQSGQVTSASIAYERALSSTAGVGMNFTLERQKLRDAGYSSKGGEASVFGYREFGRATLVASISRGRLKADERLFFYTARRDDQFKRASLGATMRQFAVGEFAPFIRVTHEVNRSSVAIFSYRRTHSEIGITHAF